MTRLRDDEGVAVLEVLVLGVGLLVPLLYGALSIMAVQSASFASTAAARQAARAFVTAGTVPQARDRAEAASALVLADAALPPSVPRIRCPGGCLMPGSRVDVTVHVEVTLPLLPGSPTIGVQGTESMPVDRYREVP